jgi:pimeloyl-ACP methyl ester carboxylesterase
MAKNIYALLVGIDNYHPASSPLMNPLTGCLNDIKAIETYLRDRISFESEWTLVESTDIPWILTNEQATRQAIINGFQQHLCNADSDDVVLFYYAGHGSQEKVPEAFSHLKPDNYNETLVCYDSRTKDSWDIADKELGYLISQVSKNNPHTVVILDCCHSGTGTRDSEIVRQAPSDEHQRPWESFIFANDPVALDKLASSNNLNRIRFQGFGGKHIALAACRSHETAKEHTLEDGQRRGAFSYFLTEALRKTNGGISYRDLVRNVSALVIGQVKEQSPQIEAINTKEHNQPFLGGAIGERPQYFTLSYNKNHDGWVIDGGALHGVPKSSNGGNTFLAVFPVGSNAEELHQLPNAIVEAEVTQVLPQISKVEIIRDNGLSRNQAYWAVVTSIPLAPLKVYIQGGTGEETGVELARQAHREAGPNQKPSLYVDVVDSPQSAYCTLSADNGQYWITKDNLALVAPIPEQPDGIGYTSDRATKAIQQLEHMARWNNILTLESPATSFIKLEQVEMYIEILSGQDVSSSSCQGNLEQRVQYTNGDGGWKPPVIQVKLTNNSSRTLYCNVLELSESYGIYLPFFEERSSISIPAYASIERNNEFYIPDAFLERGVTEYKEIFKLIVSTAEFDAGLLEQDGLNPPPQTRSLNLIDSTFNLLLHQVNTREPGHSSRKLDDWMTKSIAVTIVRPQDAIQIRPHESTTLLDGAVQLQPHSSLQAKANLTTLPQVSRDVGEKTLLPPIFLQNPDLIQPFQFTTTRGSDPGLSILELVDVEDYTVITPENPLKLLVNTSLEEGEYILPVSSDGEFFLPLGKGERTVDGKTEIRLERLPSPVANSRSFQGSIRILFQKILNQKLGRPYEYPILAIADVRKDGINYEKNREKVKEQVAQSHRISLYIHGIIGDTTSLLTSVQKATVEMHGQQHALKEMYDLVLAFDYENLNTTIEENAQLLKQKLEEVGLTADCGKELHIVAHSMGGLIARWFIEREEGNQIVQHLVMLGTPNAGSPWSSVQDWAFAMLGIGLNQLSAVIWPAKVIAYLLALLEANDNSLEQMQLNSNFLKELANNPDPRVPYTIVAGNRSIVADALQPKNQSSRLQRLMNKLFARAIDRTVDLVFFEQPNDIAVSLASIKSVSSNRSPQPRILEPDAACDHLTYFTTTAGLEALMEALTS